MDDISTLDEARDLLEHDDLSMANIRQLLIFLVGQNSAERRAISRNAVALIDAVELLLPIIERLPLGPDFNNQLLAITKSLEKLTSSMRTDLALP